MIGADDIRPVDEILSNTSSPCESDSPTCFIRQSTFKTKEPFTQYPCLGNIYFADNLKYFLISYKNIFYCENFRSIS